MSHQFNVASIQDDCVHDASIRVAHLLLFKKKCVVQSFLIFI